MASWSRFFDFPCAQLLLTYDDINNRKRFVNAKNTIKKLLEFGTLPIVNENDSVATEEIKIGDNDRLAARVAQMVDADLLILFLNYNKKSATRAKRIDEVICGYLFNS